MKVIVAGGRELIASGQRILRVARVLKRLGATEVVSGCAKGGDHIGELAAGYLSLPVKKFPADWEGLGKGAGFARNREMADYADALIALPGGRGTASMIAIAESKKLPVTLIGR